MEAYENRGSAHKSRHLPARNRIEIIGVICSRAANGEPLTLICQEDGMPGRATVYEWAAKDDAIRAMLDTARRDQADSFADQVLAVARAAYGKTNEDIQASKLEIDALKWRAGMQAPKKWGNKTQLELSGELDVKSMSKEEMQRELAELLPKLQDLAAAGEDAE